MRSLPDPRRQKLQELMHLVVGFSSETILLLGHDIGFCDYQYLLGMTQQAFLIVARRSTRNGGGCQVVHILFYNSLIL